MGRSNAEAVWAMLPWCAVATQAKDRHPKRGLLSVWKYRDIYQTNKRATFNEKSHELCTSDAQRCKSCCRCRNFALHLSSLPVQEFMEMLAADVGEQESLRCVGTRPCCGWAHLNARSNSVPATFLHPLLPWHGMARQAADRQERPRNQEGRMRDGLSISTAHTK